MRFSHQAQSVPLEPSFPLAWPRRPAPTRSRRPAPARHRNLHTSGLLGRRTGGRHHRNRSGDAGRRLQRVLATVESAGPGHSGGRGPRAGLSTADHRPSGVNSCWTHTTTCARCPARTTIGLTAPAEVRCADINGVRRLPTIWPSHASTCGRPTPSQSASRAR